MKRNSKHYIAAAALAILGSTMSADTSKTFFVPRSTSSDSGLQLTLNNYHYFHSDYCDKPYVYPVPRSMICLQNTYFYQQTASGTDLAKYFFLGNKTTLEVRENGSGDIGSPWLGIATPIGEQDFASNISIKPKRQVFGGLIDLYVDFSRLINGLWMDILVPVVEAIHDLKFTETILGPLGVLPDDNGVIITDATVAFNLPSLVYGKLNPGKMRMAGVDDIQVKLAYDFLQGCHHHLALYANALIPMGSASTGEFMFEPYVGSRHFGLGVGLNADFRIFAWHCGKFEMNIMTDFKYRYLFSAHERRSFDLTPNGQWSRYLGVVKSTPTDANRNVNLSGPDFLTRDLQVVPRNTIDWWTALHFKFCKFHVELGYDLWWKSAERVSFRRPWQTDVENLAIFDISNDDTNTEISASQANISQTDLNGNPNQAPSDSVFTRITGSNIDLTSATQDSALSNKVIGGISWNCKFLGQPSMLGVSGSYEWANKNTAANQWSVALRTSLSF